MAGYCPLIREQCKELACAWCCLTDNKTPVCAVKRIVGMLGELNHEY